jgi:hypothetical protein
LLSVKYARPQSVILEIISKMASFINRQWGHLLVWDSEGLLSPTALRIYADTLHAFGAPTRSVLGFLDCTISQTCRPGEFQELVYMGYKKFHGMKFQGVVIPNGLIAHLKGPFRAPQNDSGILNELFLMQNIATHMIQAGSQPGDPLDHRFYQLYGDSVYGVSPYIVSPYSGVGKLTDAQKEWNMGMGRVRISMEHGFGLVLQDWPYLHAFWKHQVLGNTCGLMYHIAVLLTNTHACLVPNQTSVRYSLDPPMLEEYFHA